MHLRKSRMLQIAASALAIFVSSSSALAESQQPAPAVSLKELIIPGLGWDNSYAYDSLRPMIGTWWAQTIYDENGQPVWESDGEDQPVELRVGLDASFTTIAECNTLQGQFEVDEAGQPAVKPLSMITSVMACMGECPPTVAIHQTRAFVAQGSKLTLLNAAGTPLATYQNALDPESQAEELRQVPTLPLDIHALSGLWWAQTIYGADGEPAWYGGTTDQKVVLRIGLAGSIQTVNKCNMIRGQFTAAIDGKVSLLEPRAMMSTRMFCPDDYPPVVSYQRVEGYARTGLYLTFFDADGFPIATFLDVNGLTAELDALVN